MPELSTSTPQGNNLRNMLHDDAINFIKQCPKTGRHFAGIIGAKLPDADAEDLESVGSCTTKSGISCSGRMTFGDCFVSPTPSSIFPTDTSTMASPTPSNLYPNDVSAFTSPAAPSIYPRDVATLTSPSGMSIFPKDVAALAAMRDDDSDSESENGTLSGSENGLDSDDEDKSASEGAHKASAPSKAPWKSWPRRAGTLDNQETDEALEQRCPEQHEERWRIAGSRLANIFQQHSDSEGSHAEPQQQPEELSPTHVKQQDERWRIAGKRLAAIFQDESESEGNAPAGILRA